MGPMLREWTDPPPMSANAPAPAVLATDDTLWLAYRIARDPHHCAVVRFNRVEDYPWGAPPAVHGDEVPGDLPRGASTRWSWVTTARRGANAGGSSPFQTPCWSCGRRTGGDPARRRGAGAISRARRTPGLMPRRPVIGVMGGSASAPRRSRRPGASAASPPRRDGWCSREDAPPESWKRRPRGPSPCPAA